MNPTSKISFPCLFATAVLLAVTAHAADAKKTTEGTNPKGDMIHWSDGTTWARVTVTKLEVRGDSAETARLEITNVPPGFTAGWFSNFTTVALRGESSAPPHTNSISAVRLYTDGYTPPSFRDLPAPKGRYEDVYACPWQEVWSTRGVMPEFCAKAEMDGRPVLLQFRIMITHVAVERGEVHCLVRRHSANNGTAIEGWFSGITKVVFGERPTD